MTRRFNSSKNYKTVERLNKRPSKDVKNSMPISRNNAFNGKVKEHTQLENERTINAVTDKKLLNQVSRAYFTLDTDSSPDRKSDATAEKNPNKHIDLPVFQSNSKLKENVKEQPIPDDQKKPKKSVK